MTVFRLICPVSVVIFHRFLTVLRLILVYFATAQVVIIDLPDPMMGILSDLCAPSDCFVAVFCDFFPTGLRLFCG